MVPMVHPQLIQDGFNFISPKYSVSGTEDSTPGLV